MSRKGYHNPWGAFLFVTFWVLYCIVTFVAFAVFLNWFIRLFWGWLF